MEGLAGVLLLYKILCGMVPMYKSSSPILLLHDRRNHPSCGRKLFPARWVSEYDCQIHQGQEKVRKSLLRSRPATGTGGVVDLKKRKPGREQRTGANMHSLEENEIFQ